MNDHFIIFENGYSKVYHLVRQIRNDQVTTRCGPGSFGVKNLKGKGSRASATSNARLVKEVGTRRLCRHCMQAQEKAGKQANES